MMAAADGWVRQGREFKCKAVVEVRIDMDVTGAQ